MNRLKVLHIAKWYPNKEDIQNGVFVQKHVESVSKYTDSTILFFKQITDQIEDYSISKSDQPNYRSYIVYHKPLKKLRLYNLKQKLLKSIIDEIGKPDVLHFHILSLDQWIGYRYAKRNGIPFVITEHWSGYVDNRFRDFRRYKKKLYARMISNAFRVLPVSGFLKKSMQACKLSGNYEVIPNIVETNSLHPFNKYEKFTFLMVADLVDSVKNISGVIDSFLKLDNQNEVQLHIIGGGPDEEELKKKVNNLGANNILFLGRLDNNSVLNEMNRCHCIVVNSVLETFSVVALEARAAGLHLISTKCGGPEELVDKYSHFIDSPSDLIRALKLVQKQDVPPKLPISPYSLHSVGNKINSIYNSSVSKNI